MEKKKIFNSVDNVCSDITDNLALNEACRIVAKEQNVETRTVKRIVVQLQKNPRKNHGNCKLTVDEEDMLLMHIFAADINGRQMGNEGIKQVANFIVSARTGDEEKVHDQKGRQIFSQQWISLFRKRHADFISITRPRPIVKARAKAMNVNEVRSWHNKMKWLAGRKRAKLFFNLDESIVTNNNKRLQVYGRTEYNSLTQEERSTGIMVVLPVISMEGVIVVLFVIMKMKVNRGTKKNPRQEQNYEYSIPADTFKPPGAKYDTYTFYTETGWLNGDLWKTSIGPIVVQKIGSYIRNRGNAILFLDNLGAHSDLDINNQLIEKGCIPLPFPPNTTHFLQPLDSYPFANFKRGVEKLGTELRNACHVLGNEIKDPRIEVALVALHVALTKKAIVGSFRDTGLYPADFNVVRNNIQKKKT